jgi:succinoglycan biosynthesis transport protein ExoP
MRGIFVASMRKSAHGLPSTTLLVTSCARGDGKTTLLASLAVYAAQLGRPVLVIDFNFRDPGLERVLGKADDPVAATGDLLSSLRPEMRIRHSRAFGVDYVSLPDGRFDPLSVLESEAFPQAFARLKETYAYVMMDSGSILTATETRLLAKVADHVILTVRRGVTDVAAAQAAVQHLRAAGADFSLVMNQARLARSRNQAAFRVPAVAVN